MLKVGAGIFVIGALAFLMYFFHIPTQTKIISLKDAVQTIPQQNLNKNTYVVVRIVDGDTFVIQNGTTTEKVRIIGINTPESVDPRRHVECYGVEASNALKQKIQSKNVRLEPDSTQQNTDKYGRLLRHVFLDDENVGAYMIGQGFAYEYTYSNEYTYQNEYKKAQFEARMANRGLWSPQACK